MVPGFTTATQYSGGAFSLTHAYFKRFLAIRFIGEYANPELSAALYLAVERNTGCFKLTISKPERFKGNEGEIAEINIVSPGSVAFYSATLNLPVFSSFWTECHTLTPSSGRTVTARCSFATR